jgi:hypothetical protein
MHGCLSGGFPITSVVMVIVGRHMSPNVVTPADIGTPAQYSGMLPADVLCRTWCEVTSLQQRRIFQYMNTLYWDISVLISSSGSFSELPTVILLMQIDVG